MKILKVSNMYPSKQKAYAGIFVKNQYEELQKQIQEDDQLEIFYMKRAFTGKVGSLLKYASAFIRFTPYLFKKHDVVHVHYFYPLVLLAWFKKKIWPKTKIVVTFLGRDINSQVNESNQDFYRKISKSVDYSIPVGVTMAQQVEKKLGLNRVSVLACGVDENIFYPEKETPKEFDYVFVGSFIHRKGIDTIIEAIKKLDPADGISFCFCGSGEYLSQLEELAKDYAITIKQNQTQSQIRGLLNKGKFFLLMSRAEGFATATTEAFFCGVPVLLSDIPNFIEQVEEGKNGYNVPLGNADALKTKLEELHQLPDDTYQAMSEAAVKSFRNASLQVVCSEIYKIYEELVAEEK